MKPSIYSSLLISKKKDKLYNAFPFPIQTAKELEEYCKKENTPISEIVLKNELSLKSQKEIDQIVLIY